MAVEARRKLKERLAARAGILVPGAANAMTARVIEELGYEAVYVTGAGVTNMSLGLPDHGLITLSEIAEHVRAIAEVTELPIIVDGDTGFGNPVNVWRTVRMLERAGASAIQIEDQIFPKKCGHFAGKEVVPTGEMVQKIRAAVDARRDGNFQIIARTDARAVHGFEDAISRAEAFIAAGADVTFVEAPTSRDELAEIPRRLAVPQVANMVHGGKTPILPQRDFAAMRYGCVLYANAALQAALLATQKVLGALLRDGSLEKVGDLLAGFDERQRAVGKPFFDALEAKYKD
jgi:2-methylisocitrate lyase-like PEP mutase family enzyme